MDVKSRTGCGDGAADEQARVPRIDLDTWRFRVWGQVAEELEWDWERFSALPRSDHAVDLRCTTGSSLLGRRWSGISTRELLSRVRLRPDAAFVMVHAHGGYCANLSLHSFGARDVVFAMASDGTDLTPERGWPLRLIVPRVQAFKSVKWVRGLEFLNKDWPGSR